MKINLFKALSRISYWGGMVNVIIPYSFIFIILIIYADAFSFGVPFFYIQNQIFNCIFQQNKYWGKSVFRLHRCWWRILETQIVTNIAVSPYFFQFYTDNLTDSLAEACDCLSVLQLPPETKIIDQQLPDIVFQTCRGLGKAYIDRQMLKQYDRS